MSVADPAQFIGLMSGTSADGMDAAWVRFSNDGQVAETAVTTRPYPRAFRERLQYLMQPVDNDLALSCEITGELTRHYADIVIELMDSNGIEPSQVSALGCHGQTIRHDPDGQHPYTLQLVNGALLAHLTGLTVVNDFRSADIAAGGQGAPLAPAFHHAVMSSESEHRVILNLGGIANITSLVTDGEQPVIGFDTGPANTLLDGWSMRHRGIGMDDNGDWARTGNLSQILLEKLLQDPYFDRPPPKSTGLDYFHLQWLDNTLQDVKPSPAPADVQATLAHLTVQSVTDAIERHCNEASAILVCGGGASNGFLMDLLATSNPGRRVATTMELGVNPDYVEALAFAWLAMRRLNGLAGNLPTVTGAARPCVMGAVHLP